MALIYEMSVEQKQLWDDWKNERPLLIKEMAERFEPNRLYVLKTTGQNVVPAVFHEDGTMTVAVLQAFNDRIFPSKKVFGINPDDLEEASTLPHGMSVMSFDQYMGFD